MPTTSDVPSDKEINSTRVEHSVENRHQINKQISTSVKPLRIAVYGIRTIPSTYSGYETFCNVLLPELVARGHDVTLFAREAFGRQESYKDVKKIGLPSINTKQLDTISHSFVCAAVSRFGQFDVVLSFNVANAPSLAILSKTGVPTVLNVDGLEWKRGKWGKLARSVFYHCAKISKRTSTQLITDCVEMQQIYEHEFSADTHVIPYCWTGLLAPDEMDKPDAEYLGQFGIKARNYMITGGRLVPENNIAEIVESHISSNSDMPIVVLGEANYDSEVQKRLYELAMSDERVKLVGHISDRRGFGLLLRDAYVYLHGHSVGGINPSLVEAMGVGAVVCAYDTSFNREAIGDCGLYFKTPTAAVHEFIEASKSADINAFRVLGRDRVREKYSVDRIVDLYEDLLVKTTEDKRGNKLNRKNRIKTTETGLEKLNDEYVNGTRFGLAPAWHDLNTQAIRPTLYTLGGKRVIDIALSALMILALSPVMVVVAFTVWAKLGSNIVYRQKRIGRHGNTFDIVKFRTMLPEQRLTDFPVENDRRVAGHKTEADPRHTSFGKKLRKIGFDELPQLFNVLKGDMSLVGPRPELDKVARARGYFLHSRHLVRPGITGPYQLSPLREFGDLRKGLPMDEQYLQNLSLLGDLRYILRTPSVLLSRFGRTSKVPRSIAESKTKT